MKRCMVLVLAGLVGCADSLELSDVEEHVESTGPVVVINEFTAGTSGKVELYNAGTASANLASWQVDDIDGGYAPKSLGTSVTLAPGAYLVVSYAGINTASTNQVRLLDP